MNTQDAFDYARYAYDRVRQQQETPNRLHKTKTAICQMLYNRMDITDMDQMTPNGPYEVY